MGQAEQLSQAATDLKKNATTYANAVGQIDKTSGFVSGLAADLLNGKTAWSGKGSSAFQTAWNKSYEDAQNVNKSLNSCSASMNMLATTINDNLGPIQRYESLEQIEMTSLPQSGWADYRKSLLSAQQDSDNALHTITTKAQNLAMTLSSDQTVGVCSMGTVTVPLSPNMTGTNNYWIGFMAGVLASQMADGGDDTTAVNADTTATSADQTCPAPSPGLTPQQERVQLTIAMVVGALIAAGGSSFGSWVTGGDTEANVEVGVVAFLAYMASPHMKDPVEKFVNQLDQKCNFKLTPKAKSLLVSNIVSSIRNSALTGLVGGRLLIPFIKKLLHPAKSTSTPTPASTPKPVPTPTPVVVPIPVPVPTP